VRWMYGRETADVVAGDCRSRFGAEEDGGGSTNARSVCMSVYGARAKDELLID
jgi:hypothetical protein